MPHRPVPEPTARDEDLALAFIRRKDDTSLQGVPAGDQRCGGCHFHAGADAAIAYCWHPSQQALVGSDWWCDRWAPVGGPDATMAADQLAAATRLRQDLVEANRWVVRPASGEQCQRCLHYLSPDDTVSYCWNPRMQVGVGFDHGCAGWARIPGEA